MDGQYNVPADPNEPYTYYQSVPKLPPQKSFYRESNELASVLRNEIADFLSRHCIPEFNEILSPVFGNYAIGESPSDRTMCFYIGDLNAFVPELVLTLQKRVLTRYPLWRLVAQFEELVIGVYPDGVWFDDNIVMGSFTSDHPVYRAWFDKALEYRESRFGALARQLDFACRKIPEAIVNMADNPYCLIGVFDKYQSHLEGFPVWFLHDGNRDLSIDDEFAPVRTSAVAAGGLIYPEFSKLFYPKTKMQPPYWLKTQLMNDVETNSRPVKDENGREIGKIEWNTIINVSTLK